MLLELFKVLAVILILLCFIILYIIIKIIGLNVEKLLWSCIFGLLYWNDIKPDDQMCKDFKYEYSNHLEK